MAQGQLEQRYDVVVVGGGAAGLAGATAVARMRRSVLLVDAGEPRNAPAEGVHNLLGSEGVPPAELYARGRADLVRFGGVVVAGRVTSLSRDDQGAPGPFVVTLEDGRTTTARRLLLAAGARDVLPEVPGVAGLWGTGVLQCPFCHGWELHGRAVAVLSTGPMTAHAAGLWRQVSDDVVVLTHTGPAVDPDQRAALEAGGVRFVDGEVLALERHGDGVRVRLADGAVDVAAVVAASQVVVDEALTGQLGVEVVPVEVGGAVIGTRVVVDAVGATTVPGVFAAGNVTTPAAVVVASAAGGLAAGAAMTMGLVAEDATGATATTTRAGAAR